jgi:hypothetical protein
VVDPLATKLPPVSYGISMSDTGGTIGASEAAGIAHEGPHSLDDLQVR